MPNIIQQLGGFSGLLKQSYRDKGDGTYALIQEAYPPVKLMTDSDGASARLRVDNGSTGFFAGREFRTFLAFNLAAGASIYIKAVLPIDVILDGLGIDVDDGYVKLEAFVLPASQSGFVTPLPIIGANRMLSRPQPYYNPQVTFLSGGTFTGGTLLDVLTVKTANSSASASTQSAAVAGERGLAPGDYYLKLTSLAGSGASVGMVKARWEERV